MDLISEGEIEGLVDGAKSIFFDETQLQNEDGSFNFTGVTYDTRNGTQDQTYIDGFTTVENETAVGVEVKNGGDPATNGVVRQITDPNVNRVRVRVLVPQITSTDTSTGDVHGSSVELTLWVQPNGGSFTQVADCVITGKSSSRYERDISVQLTGSAPWNIRLQRETADSAIQYLVNKTYFEAYTEVVDAKLRYPNSAIVAARLDSQQFEQVPTRYYDVKLLKIKVPSNYDPTTRVYTGIWDGTFQTLWSDNPAWVFYDLLTSDRYGLGSFVPEDQVDKWALYEISQYCDALVPDGFGGMEPRFTCNLMLADRGEAYTVLQSLASVFRGMIYWAAGSVTASQDSPQDAAYIFNTSNVVDGRFLYQGASAKARHSVALVTWNDPADFYKQKVEYVEDQNAIAKFGVQQAEVVAFGCTSRGQAHRLGKWLLYTEQFESESVTFRTGLEGIVGRPGQIIQIADPARAGARLGGRISSATTTAITIDQDISGSISGNTLSVLLPTGAVEERTVVGQAGRVITVQPGYSTAPLTQSVWVLKSDAVEPQTFRVISIKEDSDSRTYEVTALKHDPDKFDFVEEDILLEPKSYSLLKAATEAPQNLIVTESLYQTATEVKSKITLSWSKVDRAVSYIVRYRRDNENFIQLNQTSVNEIDILDTQPGSYTFQVVALNAIGKSSAVSQLTTEAYGKLAPPVDVQGFSMIPNAGQAYLTWRQATDLDVLVGGQVRIRHTPKIIDQAWRDAIDIIPAAPGTATSAVAPLLNGTYMAKFVDSSGNYSLNEVLIVTTIPYAQTQNIVDTITEDPTFAGTKTNMSIDTLNGALVLSDGTLWDDLPLIDDVGSIDFPGEISSSGTYDFENVTDLGGVWPTRIYSTINLEAYDVGTVIDSRTTLIDTWDDIDGDTVNDVNAELYVRTTEDDPSSSPTWTDWKRISAGEYTARGFQFQLICTTGDTRHNLFIKNLQVVLDMLDRDEYLGPFTSGAGTYSVSYGFPFYAAPSIAITAVNMNSGDYYSISNVTTDGFDILFKNSGSTAVSRNFYVLAKGYGRKVA